MANGYGVSYQPGQTEQPGRSGSGSGGRRGMSPQEAVKILSLRVPERQAPGAPVSNALLNSPGSRGLGPGGPPGVGIGGDDSLTNMVQQLMQTLQPQPTPAPMVPTHPPVRDVRPSPISDQPFSPSPGRTPQPSPISDSPWSMGPTPDRISDQPFAGMPSEPPRSLLGDASGTPVEEPAPAQPEVPLQTGKNTTPGFSIQLPPAGPPPPGALSGPAAPIGPAPSTPQEPPSLFNPGSDNPGYQVEDPQPLFGGGSNPQSAQQLLKYLDKFFGGGEFQSPLL